MARPDEQFTPFWKGPFEIVRAVSNHPCEMRYETNLVVVHVDSLREHKSREERTEDAGVRHEVQRNVRK